MLAARAHLCIRSPTGQDRPKAEDWLSGRRPEKAQSFKESASIRNTHDSLSEISHPNGLGTQFLYPAADIPENGKAVARYRFMTDEAIWQTHHFAFSA
jgi:hypothetical protein